MAPKTDQHYTYQADKGRVFKALTDAPELMNWFPSKVETDPRKGGKLRYEWEFNENDKNGFQDMEYIEFVDGSKIKHTWDASGQPTTVAFTLEESEAGTHVHLLHEGWTVGMEEAAQMHSDIWAGYMQNLKNYLEGGQDMRPEMMGQITY